MRPGSNISAREAHAQLVMQLCEALSNYFAATAGESGNPEPGAHAPANDDDAPMLRTTGYTDIISLRGILVEFGLKQPQVMTLRRTCGFPEPIGPTRPLMFRRDQVERWFRSKPNTRACAIPFQRNLNPRLS
jgi:hypothetical protein